jgi:hypothetical protein
MNNLAKISCRFHALTTGLFVFLAACTLAACDETSEKLFWSPDGAKLAVLAADGLHLAGADGNLSSSLIAPEVKQIIWTGPDSAYVLRKEPFKSAQDVIDLAGPKEGADLEARSQKFLKDLVDAKGDCDKVCSGSEQSKWLSYYLAFSNPTKFAEALGNKEADKNFVSMLRKPSITVLNRFKFGNAQISSTETIMRSCEAIDQIRLSPDGLYLMYEDEKHYLHLLATTSGAVSGAASVAATGAATGAVSGAAVDTIVVRKPVHGAEWFVDSRDVVYYSPLPSQQSTDPSESSLSELRRLTVRDLTGAPIAWNAAPLSMDEQVREKRYDQTLSLVSTSGQSHIRCLNDGAIVFSSGQLSLPARLDDPARENLFLLRGNGPIAPLLTQEGRDHLKYNFYCVPSPDNTALAVQSAEGLIEVIKLKTNEIVPVADYEHFLPSKKLVTYPSWRGNDELTFEAVGKDAEPVAVDPEPKAGKAKAKMKNASNKPEAKKEPSRQVISWSLKDHTWRRLDLSWPKTVLPLSE